MTHILAYVVNAHSEPEITYALGSCSASGQWWTNEGTQVWPFWTQAIELPDLSIPEGWIEHLHTEAAKFATKHKADIVPKQSLLAKLGIGKPKLPTITRRL